MDISSSWMQVGDEMSGGNASSSGGSDPWIENLSINQVAGLLGRQKELQ
jgi:hypothetical protein